MKGHDGGVVVDAFDKTEITDTNGPTASLFVSLRYAPASSKPGRWAVGGDPSEMNLSCFANYKEFLFCFPRDTQFGQESMISGF
jgi:hypothetical protein